jgi:hypothetical protein
MAEITRILEAIDGGDAHAAEKLLPLVYDELRRLAADGCEKCGLVFPQRDDAIASRYEIPDPPRPKE